MNFSFNIEDDTLFLNVTTPTEEEDTFTIKKTPIINREAFAACFKYWVLQEQDSEKDPNYAPINTEDEDDTTAE